MSDLERLLRAIEAAARAWTDYTGRMGKGDGGVRANLRATRTQITNATGSAQTRAFKERQIAKQKRDAEERKLRAAQAAARRAADAAAASVEGETTGPDAERGVPERPGDPPSSS